MNPRAPLITHGIPPEKDGAAGMRRSFHREQNTQSQSPGSPVAKESAGVREPHAGELLRILGIAARLPRDRSNRRAGCFGSITVKYSSMCIIPTTTAGSPMWHYEMRPLSGPNYCKRISSIGSMSVSMRSGLTSKPCTIHGCSTSVTNPLDASAEFAESRPESRKTCYGSPSMPRSQMPTGFTLLHILTTCAYSECRLPIKGNGHDLIVTDLRAHQRMAFPYRWILAGGRGSN